MKKVIVFVFSFCMVFELFPNLDFIGTGGKKERRHKKRMRVKKERTNRKIHGIEENLDLHTDKIHLLEAIDDQNISIYKLQAQLENLEKQNQSYEKLIKTYEKDSEKQKVKFDKLVELSKNSSHNSAESVSSLEEQLEECLDHITNQRIVIYDQFLSEVDRRGSLNGVQMEGIINIIEKALEKKGYPRIDDDD